MDYKTIDQAVTFLRQHMAKHNGDLPDWGRYQQLVKDRLFDPDLPRKFKMPPEYHYAYLRGKGLSDADARERMGLTDAPRQAPREEESMWGRLKFWR